MAEDIPATPGWVEKRLDEIWSKLYLPNTDVISTCRNVYLGCLAACGIGANSGRCHDNCRADCMTCLRGARVAPDTIRALEAELEAMEAELCERT
jgi:hypothetical protein